MLLTLCRLSWFFLILFIFFLLLLDNFKWPVFKFAYSLFCLIESATEAIAFLKYSHCILKLQNLFGSFYIFYCFVELLVLFFYRFPDLVNCLSVFSCRSLSFLEQFSSNSYQEFNSYSLELVTYWQYIVFLWCYRMSLILHDTCSLV